MLKKLIILFGLFAIENNLTGAQVDFNPMNFITPATRADLANANFDGTCPICQESENDINMLFDISMFYKANCPQMVTHPHIFHRDCILGWIASDQPSALNCPACRGQMVDLNVDLIEASRNGRIEIVQLLLDIGADINARNNDGYTSLMFASMRGYIEIVRFLIDRGADVHAKANSGYTSLMSASQNRYLETVILLLNKGANVNARTIHGQTALMEASLFNRLEIVRLLLDRGASINAKTVSGYTALMLAHYYRYPRIADLLIARGAIE